MVALDGWARRTRCTEALVDFSTIPASIMAASPSQGDTRSRTVQQVDYGTPHPRTDALGLKAESDLLSFVYLRGMLGQSFGNNPPVSQQDINNAFSVFANDLGNVSQAQQVTMLFDTWNTDIQDDGLGLDLDGRAAQAAVSNWSTSDLFQYFGAMLEGWKEADQANGTQTAHSELSARLDRLAALGGAPKPAPLPGQGPPQIIHVIPGLTKTGQQPASKPLSTPAKVAIGAGGASAVALGVAAVVAWAKGETLGYVLKKAWHKVAG
jgi:hypothetical protein